MTVGESRNPRALVIDDEPDLCELLSLTLNRMQIDTDACGDVATARKNLAANSYELCLTDMRLPDGDGLELVEWMQAEGISTPVIERKAIPIFKRCPNRHQQPECPP